MFTCTLTAPVKSDSHPNTLTIIIKVKLIKATVTMIHSHYQLKRRVVISRFPMATCAKTEIQSFITVMIVIIIIVIIIIGTIIIIINPLTARIVKAPQMFLQPVLSIFPCSPLPSVTWRTPGLSIHWCCLPSSSSVALSSSPLKGEGGSDFLNQYFTCNHNNDSSNR